jgi:hypothetical protein
MIEKLHETVLTYRDDQYRAWKAGDKSLVPSFLAVPPAVLNQPSYHFGEVFTLSSYHERLGWFGFFLFALGTQFPESRDREEGRRKLAEIIPAAALQRFRSVRAADSTCILGRGEPDLFLYKDDGSFMFVEVKKGPDKISQAQLTCIAQIRAILRCPVDIVYLCTENQRREPKTYMLDLGPWLSTESA